VSTLRTLVAGVDPDHVPALLAAVAYALVAPFTARLARLHPRTAALLPAVPVDIADRVAGWLLADSAAIHLALPIGHHDNPLRTVLFLGSGVAYGHLGWRALTGRRYRLWSALLVVATLVAYVGVVAAGGEGADQVGIATAVQELLALGICMVPRSPGRLRRATVSTGFVLVVALFGAVVWVTALATHPAGGHGADRTQAGVIMAPSDGEDAGATPAQRAAAADLAARTTAALRRFTDIHAALAAGYTPSFARAGLRVHLENKAYEKDGQVLDPDRPEELMYAIDGGKATLLSAVYQMERAGTPGPTPGGPLTRWHAHDICLTAVLPAFSVVSTYGTCPLVSVSVTTAEMMHVWVVDEPGGPYADDAPDNWIRAFNQAHGVPFGWAG
jgi:hypothetical protein